MLCMHSAHGRAPKESQGELHLRTQPLNMRVFFNMHFAVHPGQVLLLLAGHSLGGALAQLAAHDIATAAAKQGLTVSVGCYTFGAPRVGNHAFANEYNKLVPHTWHIINDQVR
jgi:predicted lipase